MEIIEKTIKKPHFIRRMYDWVLHWAHTRYGTPALTLLAFAESSFFPIPPDPLLIALAVSRPEKSLWYALICLSDWMAVMEYYGYFFL